MLAYTYLLKFKVSFGALCIKSIIKLTGGEKKQQQQQLLLWHWNFIKSR